MAITRDGYTWELNSTPTDTVSFLSHSIDADASYALLWIAVENSADSPSAAPTVGGNSMSLVTTLPAGGDVKGWLYELADPPSGSQTVAFTLTGTPTDEGPNCIFVTYTAGASATVSRSNFATDSGAATTTTGGSETIASASGELVAAAIFLHANAGASFAPTGDLTEVTQATGDVAAYGEAAGAASVDTDWAWDNARNFTMGVVALQETAAGITDLAVDAGAMSDNYVPLSWTADASQAYIHRDFSPGFTADATTVLDTLTGADTEYIDQSSASDIVIYYKITDGSYNVLSNEVSQQMPPPRPTALNVGTVTTTSVEIDVTNPSSTTRNRMDWWYRETAGGDPLHLGEFGSASAYLTQVYDGLSAGTEYEFMVRAYSTTTGLYSGFTTVTQSTGGAPNAPTDLTEEPGTTDSQVTLSWTDNAADETGYYVQRHTSTGFTPGPGFRISSDLGVDAESWTDTTVSGSTDYFYVIEVYGPGGSAYSSELQVTTPAAAPTTVRLVSGSFL